MIDFGDMLHGVDVLEEYLADGDMESASGVIDIMLGDIADISGTTANNLRYILYAGQDNWRPIQIGELREAVKNLASDYATALQITSKQTTDKGGKITKMKAKAKHDQWQAEADKIWEENPTWMKNAVAIDIKIRLSCKEAVDTIARKIQKRT